jgi:hypothetical protein
MSFAGIILDDNNGAPGTILVNTSDIGGVDVGTWKAPSAVPELKGETGDVGETGATGEAGATGNDGEGVHRQSSAGVGLDVVLWQSPKETLGVETQYKFDERNNEHSVYVVGKVNLWKWLKK